MNEKTVSALKTCIEHYRCDQLMPSIEEDKSPDYRAGYRRAMRHAESVLGLLMWECGVDLRPIACKPCKKETKQ